MVIYLIVCYLVCYLVCNVNALLPYPHKIDVVITWLNTSSQSWQKAPGNNYGPTDPRFYVDVDLPNTFIELKYTVKSLKKYRQPFLNTIYIVHSDYHDPPSYLEENTHLKFIKHSQILNAECLPTFNRNAINTGLHRIPGLLDWYIYIEDDLMLTNSFQLDSFYRNGKAVTINNGRSAVKGQPRPNNGYTGAVWTSAHLLEQTFGTRGRQGGSHSPIVFWKPVWTEVYNLWPSELRATCLNREQQPTDVYPQSLVSEYMVDVGLSQTYSDFSIAELHTNGACCARCDGIYRVGTAACAKFVQRWLDVKSKTATWINVQGPGFDDAYRFKVRNREYSSVLEKVAHEWFEKYYG